MCSCSAAPIWQLHRLTRRRTGHLRRLPDFRAAMSAVRRILGRPRLIPSALFPSGRGVDMTSSAAHLHRGPRAMLSEFPANAPEHLHAAKSRARIAAIADHPQELDPCDLVVGQVSGAKGKPPHAGRLLLGGRAAGGAHASTSRRSPGSPRGRGWSCAGRCDPKPHGSR